jgi:Transcriptional antiterminator
VASNIKEGKPLETIVKEVDKTIYNDYKVIYPRTIKPNVIIVCCTTGFGTSGKIKSMITESLPKK